MNTGIWLYLTPREKYDEKCHIVCMFIDVNNEPPRTGLRWRRSISPPF